MVRTIIMVGFFMVAMGYADNFEKGPAAAGEPDFMKMSADPTVDRAVPLHERRRMKLQRNKRLFPDAGLYQPKIRQGNDLVILPNIYLTTGPTVMCIKEPGEKGNVVGKIWPYRGPNHTDPFTGQLFGEGSKFIKKDDKKYSSIIGNIGRLLLDRYPDKDNTHKFFKHYFNIDLDDKVDANVNNFGGSPFGGGSHGGASGLQGVSGPLFSGGGSGATYREVLQDLSANPSNWEELCSLDNGCSATNPKLGTIKLTEALKYIKGKKEDENKPVASRTNVTGRANLEEVLKKAREEGKEYAFVMQTMTGCGPCNSMKQSTIPTLKSNDNVGVYLFNSLDWHKGRSYPYTEVYSVSNGERVFSQAGYCSARQILDAIGN